MTDIIEMFSHQFMQNAMLASALASVACGLIGTLVVLNRMTYLAGGVAHAAYGGIGLAFALGWPVLLCTIGFSLAASLLMGLIMLQGLNSGRYGQGLAAGSTDTAVSVLWAAGMAFGIILIELSPGYAADLMAFLFGSIMAVPVAELQIMLVFDILLIAVLGHFRRGIWAVSLDFEFSTSRGLPVRFFFLLMVGMIAVSVVLLVRVVGLILVLALLTIPPYIAGLCCRSLGRRMALASLFSFLFCFCGILIAYYKDISPGSVIIAVSAGLYFLLALARRFLPIFKRSRS